LTIVPGKKKKNEEELDWLLPRSRTLARSKKKNDASQKGKRKKKTVGSHRTYTKGFPVLGPGL
jgi:hypothetical protein